MSSAAPLIENVCRACGSSEVRPFFEARGVPVNSVLSLSTRDEAMGFPTGDIVLGFCRGCGFIYNTAFDAALLEYSERYDPTQAFSETFNRWHRALAERLVDQYDLHEKRIIEIGCGKGEFLSMLCELGDNTGVGFDPAYNPERNQSRAKQKVEFVNDFYSEKYKDVRGDFVCCKMTLEHIGPARDFMGTVRRAVGDDDSTIVLFQVPDVLRILEEAAFWDIYYEHCSYYSTGSLARLFRRNGFSVTELAREYDAQYLMIEARPAESSGQTKELEAERDLDTLSSLVAEFSEKLPKQLQAWRDKIAGFARDGRRPVIWGAGSKGVSFLTTLGIRDEIEYAVDINPHRKGLFMATTGQEIVGPSFLKDYRPGVVIVMNPIYRSEIVEELHRQGLDPEVITT